MINTKLKKKFRLVLIPIVCFAFSAIVLASGTQTMRSTYSITNGGTALGVLTGSTHMATSTNARRMSFTLTPHSSSNAGGVGARLQRRGVLGGWSYVGTAQNFHSSNRSTRTLTAGNSGTHRLRMWNTGGGPRANNNGTITGSW